MTSQTVQLRLCSGLWLAIAWVIMTAFPSWAQTGASLSGVVTNQAGATLPEVAVTIPTDGAGRYQAFGLPAGRFEIHAAKSGFADERRSGISLAAGQSATADIN